MKDILRQFVKYCLAGMIATAVDVLMFYAAAIWILPALTPDDPVSRLLGLQISPIAESLRSTYYVWDKVIAFMLSNLTAYITNVLWVFTPGRHKRSVEFSLFFVVSGVSFAAGTALGWVLIRGIGLPTTYAYGANAVASISINYVCRKFIVFKG